MLSRPEECRGCPLDRLAEGFSHPTGTAELGVMVVAEALGEHEAEQGRPLVEWAPAGSVLQRVFDKAGIDREQLLLWNVIACRPPNNKFEGTIYENASAQHCRVHFNRVLRDHPQVKVILALGNSALKHLTGYSGKNRTVSSLRGYVLESNLPWIIHPRGDLIANLEGGGLGEYNSIVEPVSQGVNDQERVLNSLEVRAKIGNPASPHQGVATPVQKKEYDEYQPGRKPGGRSPNTPPAFGPLLVVPTFHPSYLRRGAMNLFRIMVSDLLLAIDVANGGGRFQLRPEPPSSFCLAPKVQDVRDLLERIRSQAQLRVGYDIETNRSIIIDESEIFRLDKDDREKDDEEESEEEVAFDVSAALDGPIIQVQFSTGIGHAISIPFTEEFVVVIREVLRSPNPKIGHNCVHAHTSVWMGDGTWKTIRDVKVGDEVKTTNHQGEIVSRRVTETFDIKDDRPWVEVKVDGAYNKGVGRWGNTGVVCTPDHEWFLADGTRIQASKLKAGWQVLLPRQGNPDMIHGTMLGDGHISKNARLRVAHTNKEWTEAKAECFNSNVSASYSTGGFKAGWRWETGVQVPQALLTRHYTKDFKRWLQPTIPALAVWYCDDGNTTNHDNFCLALHSFGEKQAEAIRLWFDNLYGTAKLDGLNLRVWKEPSLRIFAAIAPYIPPCMEYKLPKHLRGKYNGWLKVPVPQIGQVLSVREIIPRGKSSLAQRKFCLGVDETHRFFTRAGEIANCWRFDDPLLKQAGISVQGIRSDTMWMWHHAQPDLPAHLQFVASQFGQEFPWKHLATQDLAWYGGIDAEVLHRIHAGLKESMERIRL